MRIVDRSYVTLSEMQNLKTDSRQNMVLAGEVARM